MLTLARCFSEVAAAAPGLCRTRDVALLSKAPVRNHSPTVGVLQAQAGISASIVLNDHVMARFRHRHARSMVSARVDELRHAHRLLCIVLSLVK